MPPSRIQQYCYLAPAINNVCIRPRTANSKERDRRENEDSFSVEYIEIARLVREGPFLNWCLQVGECTRYVNKTRHAVRA
jgi:hypothetical protein